MKRVLLAATLLAMPIVARPIVARAQPVQGVYIGGSFGANFLEQERLRGSTPSGINYKAGYTGLGSVGYAFGNGVRLEVEGDYRFNHIGKGSASAFGGNESKYGAMGNVLFDMDIGSRYVFPYIGAGAGYQQVQDHFLNTSPSAGAFAYQAMVGAAFPIPGMVGLSATTEFRYLGLAGDRSFTAPISDLPPNQELTRRITQDNNYSLLLGVRYAFNVVPPAPPPAATPVAATAPAPAQARSYLVFFDWDRADLTPRARQIVAEAAQASTHVELTRIEVDGHADRSGKAAYNQALSLRRAKNVSAELVRLGVPQQSITVQGFGDTRPLVPTAAGVREPQNRRVEIIFK
jgi:outer membrane protein OmpA-like peptidoglycan-associated protein